MQAVILCGGKGTRLREYTENIPKPLVEIGGKPILWHILKIYASFGFKEFILCLGYKGEAIKEYFKGKTEWNIIFADTGIDTNTGGRIKRIEKYIDGDIFFATYSDGLANINLTDLLAFHKNKKNVVTITAVNPLSQFGILEIDDECNIINFKEKPLLNQWINGGFFVFNRQIFDYIGDNDILEKMPFERLAQERKISSYKFNGFWMCMDTYKDTQILNEMWDMGNAPWRV